MIQDAVDQRRNSCRNAFWRAISAVVKSRAASGFGRSIRCHGVVTAIVKTSASASSPPAARGAHGLEDLLGTGEPLEVLLPLRDELGLGHPEHDLNASGSPAEVFDACTAR